MENPKIKPPKTPKKVSFFLEQKSVLSHDVVTQKNRKLEFFVHATKLSELYPSCEYPSNVVPSSDDFDDWCSHVNSITVDLKQEFDPSIEALELCKSRQFNYWKHVLSEFMAAIKEYRAQQKEFDSTSQISTESAKRFLFLVPILAGRNPRVYIDSSNGCFNVDMHTRDNGILSTQISDNGQVYYSYVARNKRIFKITGTAKFKDSRDYIKFNKVLQML